MHIEPGFIAQAKILMANVAAGGVLLGYFRHLVLRPANVIRAVIAALFFTVFMQSFHMPVGPSELHFVGAMVMYMTLGFVPTLFGFAAGLLLQGLVFNPGDLLHLGVNSLSLIVPLIAVHFGLGRRLREQGLAIAWSDILKLDASYYAGVTAMVGFWLTIAEVTTPFAAWLAFATSYLAIIVIEPVVTYAGLRLLKRYEHLAWVGHCFAIRSLNVAR